MQLSDPQRTRLKRLFQRHKNVRAVFLFGSHATGNVRPLSDVDIGILYEQGSRRSLTSTTLGIASELMKTLERTDIDLVELNDASTLLKYAAVVHGKPLFVRRKKELSELTFRALGEFEDFRPYLERQHERLKKRLSKL